MMRTALTASTRVRALVTMSIALVALQRTTACGPPERPSGTAVMASGADLESGNPLVTVHPLSRQVQRHALFVTLVRLDSLLQPVPYYARSWTWDATHKVLTFALFNGLRWHDGVRTTAADVAFTFMAVRDPSLGAPRAGDFAAVSNVEALNDTTVRITYNAPQPSIPIVLAELPLVPKHLLDTVPFGAWRRAAFATSPVGNGPFRFAGRVAGRRWRFVRNEAFPMELGGPPTLRQFVVAVVDEPATKFAGLVSGELDLAGVSPVMAHLVSRDPTLALETPPVLFSTVIAFNTTRAPFDDMRMRQAVSLALDRTRIVQAAVAGYAVPAGGALPPGVPMAEAHVTVIDTLRADSLLDAAGWRRGADGMRQRGAQLLRVTLLTVGSGDLAAEQLVQADLHARGIAVDLQSRELAAFLATLRAPRKDFDMAWTGVPGDLALGHLVAMFLSAQRGGALDYTGYHTPVLDSALQLARVAAAGVSARDAWRRVDSLLMHDMPVAFVYHARGVQGRSRRLQHVTMDLRGELTTIARWSRDDGDGVVKTAPNGAASAPAEVRRP